MELGAASPMDLQQCTEILDQSDNDEQEKSGFVAKEQQVKNILLKQNSLIGIMSN